MAVNIIQRPDKSITDGTYTWNSKWWAVQNPIIYKFERRDFEIDNISLVTGSQGLMKMLPGYVFTGVFDYIGKYIYINSGPYNGLYQVDSIALLGITYYVYFQGYIGDSFGGYANDVFKRTGWHLLVNVYKFDLTSLSNVLISTIRSTGDITGIVTADISGMIKGTVSTRDGSDYTKVGYLDKDATAIYHISYQEKYTDSVTSEIRDEMPDSEWPTDPPPIIPRRYYGNLAVRQIQKPNGSNMAQFIAVLPDVATLKKGDFISDFDKPVYWPGYPWDIAFIASDLLGFVQLGRHEEIVSNDDVVTGTNTADIERTDGEIDGRLLPGETRVTLTGSYVSTTKKVFLWIETADPFSSRYVTDGYVDADYVEELDGPTFSPIEITKRKAIYMNFGCYDNPVYLKWKGKEGGWNYWLFGFDQKIGTDTTANGQFEQNISDMETAEGKLEWINKKSQPYMQIGATGISVDNYTGMAGLMESVEVKMLISSSPYVWQTVLVRPGSVTYVKRSALFDVEMIIDLPYTNTLEQ